MNKTLIKAFKTITGLSIVITILAGLPTIYAMYKGWQTADLKGRWKMTFHIKSSSYKPYIGKSSGYTIYVNQESEKLKCDGEMCWVDEEEIPFSQHIPIMMEGQLNGKDLSLNYTLKGARRTTIGAIQLKMSDENKLTGTFSGTAANTAGTVEAVKILE